MLSKEKDILDREEKDEEEEKKRNAWKRVAIAGSSTLVRFWILDCSTDSGCMRVSMRVN